METESAIGIDDIARIIASYIPCTVAGKYDGKEASLIGIEYNNAKMIHHSTGSYGDTSVENIQLELKPLTVILPEHKQVIEHFMQSAIIRFSETSYFIEVFDSHKELMQEYEMPVSQLNYDAVDMLRQWGYMVPWRGLSLYELGIAINY